MKKILLILSTLISTLSITAQTIIQGTISNKHGEPLIGANVFIKGSYDGTSTDSDGSFLLKTALSGKQTIVVTFIGFTTQENDVVVNGEKVVVSFKLKEKSNRLGDIVITAGTYITADRERSVTLQPFHIVTTPSAASDICGALTSLPGTATVGEDGRLFVRGGDGYETITFIDGLLSRKNIQL